jgi:RNA polymerase sigma-70 factor (ECF subfamily)
MRCASCGQPLPPSQRPSGRQRRYCSATCRQAAYRRRAAAQQALPAAPEVDDLVRLIYPAREPTDAVAEVLLELTIAARHCRRLAPEVPPALGWRCEALGVRLQELLAELFPPVS